jgi:hypothetical protein
MAILRARAAKSPQHREAVLMLCAFLEMRAETIILVITGTNLAKPIWVTSQI